MLEVGNQVALGDVIGARSHFSLWSIMKSPLIVGTDVTNISAEAIAILSNREAIAVNQDPLGKQAFVVWKSSKTLPPPPGFHFHFPLVALQTVWAGPLEKNGF